MTTPDNFEGRIFVGNMFWVEDDYKQLTLTTEIINWKICPFITKNSYADLSVNITCDFKCGTSNLWSLDTEIEIQVFDLGKISTKKMDYCFNQYFYVGIQNIHQCTFQIPKNIDSEICFRVDGFPKPIYVDKYVLLSNSTVFREMLSDGTNAFELKDVDIDHFIVFLRLLCGYPQFITSKYVEGLLELTNNYNVQFLMNDIEEFLISSKKITVTDKRRFAEVYKLSKLQVEIMEKQDDGFEQQQHFEKVVSIERRTFKEFRTAEELLLYVLL